MKRWLILCVRAANRAALSLQVNSRPKILFYDHEGQRKRLENKTARGKLARALRDNFRSLEKTEAQQICYASVSFYAADATKLSMTFPDTDIALKTAG